MKTPPNHTQKDNPRFWSKSFIGIIFIFLTIFAVALGISLSNIPMGFLVIESPPYDRIDFWGLYLLSIGLFSVVAFALLFYQFRDADASPSPHKREVSDDILAIFWLATWILYGLPMAFREQSDVIRQNYDFYLYFSILSLAYIIIAKVARLYQRMQKITSEKEVENEPFFKLGTGLEIFEIIAFGFIAFIVILIVSFFIPDSPGFFTEAGRELILFQALASIPVEELVFRGLAIDILWRIILEIICDVKKIPETERRISRENKLMWKIDTWSWWGAIIGSGIIFGMYHVPRYGWDLWSLMYLSLFGIVAGLLRYYYGLLATYIFHLLNNIYADMNATIIGIPTLSNDFLLLFFGVLTLLILVMKRHSIFLYAKKTIDHVD